MTTKEAIIYESLKLFSTKGFDSVSTRMIARAVNASDAVIYKHFSSKREILDTIIRVCKERFIQKRTSIDIEHICWSNVEDVCMDMFHFQITDEWIVNFRRLLIVEQYNNEEMAKLYKEIFIDSVIDGLTYMFKELIDEGYMKVGNPKVYAIELYAPFFMYHTVKDDSEELLKNLGEHVVRFRENVKTKKCD